jgi:hypothetical protein
MAGEYMLKQEESERNTRICVKMSKYPAKDMDKDRGQNPGIL